MQHRGTISFIQDKLRYLFVRSHVDGRRHYADWNDVADMSVLRVGAQVTFKLAPDGRGGMTAVEVRPLAAERAAA